MRHTHTTDGQRGRGGVGLRAWGLRQGGVGILVGLLLLPVGVIAQEAGDLDTSFGVGGKVITDFVVAMTRPQPLRCNRTAKLSWSVWSSDPSTGPPALPWRATCPTAPWIRPSAATAG